MLTTQSFYYSCIFIKEAWCAQLEICKIVTDTYALFRYFSSPQDATTPGLMFNISIVVITVIRPAKFLVPLEWFLLELPARPPPREHGPTGVDEKLIVGLYLSHLMLQMDILWTGFCVKVLTD